MYSEAFFSQPIGKNTMKSIAIFNFRNQFQVKCFSNRCGILLVPEHIVIASVLQRVAVNNRAGSRECVRDCYEERIFHRDVRNGKTFRYGRIWLSENFSQVFSFSIRRQK